MTHERKPVTLTQLRKQKAAGEKFSCLTAYDAGFAQVVDDAGVDVILVGDSLGMVVQGHKTTVPVTVDDMVYHSKLVARCCERALLMVDMPFMAYSTMEQALVNAMRLMQEGGGQIVKLEGSGVQLDIVRELALRGVPVCAHLGLQPQVVHKLGGYRVQGRDEVGAQAMRDSARALEDVGADMLLLECVPQALAAEITESVSIPVIGIGAGPGTDAQVLVLHDILGITPGKPPRFSHNFMQEAGSIQAAVAEYAAAVREGRFPEAQHCFE